jgi:UDP-N-acetylmuramyl pentapeptide phosphotransferase/UDP-N-acetylglucosamine-1-phosphate transferase
MNASPLFFLLFITVFVGTFFLIPKIRKLALKLKLTDVPDSRSSHAEITPTFGGICFYFSYLYCLLLLYFTDGTQLSLTLFASISVLFLTGILDDVWNISTKLKFLGQFIGVAILMSQPDFRILTLHGFMEVYEIPAVYSIAGSMFFLLALINAFNLLDGIDGLTAITGIIVASFYTFMFYKLDSFYYMTISITTIATLLAFLRFNFSVKLKIFMGDTGSLSIGLVLGLCTLKLMSSGIPGTIALQFDQKQLPLLLMAVLFIPILDTCRVMLIRLFKGISMFKPDRNHIHHIVVDYGLSHWKASSLIGFANCTIALGMYFVISHCTPLESAFILVTAFLICIVSLFVMNKNKSAMLLKVKIKKVLLRMFTFTW